MKKKIVSGMMLTLLLVSMLTLALKTEPGRAIMPPEPEYPAIYVDPPVIEGVMPGNNITVSIKTDYLLDDIMAWQFSLTYNPLVLHGVEVTNGDLIVGGSAQFKAGTFNNTMGKLSLTIAFYFAEGEVTSGPGTLANVTFTVVDYGYSDLILEGETILIGWDFPDIEVDIINVETMPDHLGHGYFRNTEAQMNHDIAVKNVEPSPTSVKLGELVNITVVVENQGAVNETNFNVTVYYDDAVIETKTVQDLAAGASKNLTFTWNTTGVREEVYNTTVKQKIYFINATASTVPGETEIEDNTLVSPSKVKVMSQYIAVIPQSTVDPTLTPGKNYTVSIYTDYNGTDIQGWQFSLTYNPAVLKGVSVTNGDLITKAKHDSAEFTLGTFNNTLGMLSPTLTYFFYMSPDEPYVTSGPGILANITFTVVGTGDSDITLAEFVGQGFESKLKGYKDGQPYEIVSNYKPGIGHIISGYFRNTEEIVTHDVAVVSVTFSPTSVKRGEPVNITVVVENQGTVAETFTVAAYYDIVHPNYIIAEEKTVQTLEVGAKISLAFVWDTEETYMGTYFIWAEANAMPGEKDWEDNVRRSNETITVQIHTIHIRADGSVDPLTVPISTVDSVTYTLTSSIYDYPVVVERDDIIFDGNGHALEGFGDGWGLFLSGTNNVTIQNVNIKKFDYGIWFNSSSFNTVSRNNITNNHLGIWLRHSSGHSNIINNIVMGNRGGISIEESSNNHISENNITNNNWHGIELWHSSHNNVSENIITSNGDGLGILGSPNNNISGNNITNNRVGINFYSSDNNVSGNNITNNNWGISLFESSNNNISGNNITNNEEYGIWLHKSSNNTIYHNNFVDNTQHVYDSSKEPPWFSPSINTWDDGYPSGGNYWSDYEDRYPDALELDGSGIWDTPYVIDENNQDDYPLMEPWSPTPPSPVEATQELIETIETWNLSKGLETSLTSKLDNVIHQLNKGNENVAINKLTALMNQVEALRDKKITNEQADELISEAQRIIDLING